MVPFALFAFAIFADPAPSAEQSKAIAGCIEALQSQRFAVREKATKELIGFGSIAKPALRKAMQSKDGETSERAGLALARIIDAEVQSLYPMPFLDALYYDPDQKTYRCSNKVYDWCQRYFETTGRDSRPWHKYRMASEVMVRDQLANGASVRFLRIVLANMHARDEVFIGTQAPAGDDEFDPPTVVDWREYLKRK